MTNELQQAPASPKNQNTFFKDKVYLVTGASGGLGRSIALALASQGVSVVLSGRNVEKLEAVYDEIEAAGYPEAAIFPFDLEQTEEQVYQNYVDAIYNEFKRLDGIVNAACYLGVIGPISDQPFDFWLKVHQINAHAAFMLSKVSIPMLALSPSSSITFISDSSARKGNAYWGAYGTSKIAVEGFASTLADELDSTSVHCNVFVPGASILPIRKKTHPGEHEGNQTPSADVSQCLLSVISCEKTGQSFTV